MVVLDLKKIKELEKKYQNDRISLNALNNMIMLVTTHERETMNSSLVLDTLRDLGVIVVKDIESKGQVQQLNS